MVKGGREEKHIDFGQTLQLFFLFIFLFLFLFLFLFKRFYLERFPSFSCWTQEHYIIIGFSLALLSLFIPLTMRMSSVGGNIGKVAVYHWFNWSFDQPDLRRIGFLSSSYDFLSPFSIVCVSLWVNFSNN